MMAPRRRTAPLGVRVTAISGISVIIGTFAHVCASGMSPGLSSLLASSLLVGALVLCVVRGGRAAAAGVRRLGADLDVEDAAAGASLVLGQFVVHWSLMGQPMGSQPALASAGHMGMPAGGPGLAAGAPSPGMVTSHALAALLVGCLLRWVEAGIVRCADLMSCLQLSARSATGFRHLALEPGGPIAPGPATLRVGPRRRNALLPALRAALRPVDRRGPPLVVDL